jgi:sterol desaturase/sphingolipid hydroxylase (fatty acid hydroxylase superfamily)
MTAAPVEAEGATRERTLVEERPGLLAVFGARHPLLSLVFAAPLGAVFVALAWTPGRGGATVALEIAAGVVYWTFFEYAMHRWFYHWRPRAAGLRRAVESFHIYHHRDMTDRRVYNAGPLLALPIAALLGAPVLAVTRDLGTTATVLIGTVGAYYIYEWCHYTFHVRTYGGGWLGYMQRFHLHHHERNWRANFGVTNPLWDLAFRTARAPNTEKTPPA